MNVTWQSGPELFRATDKEQFGSSDQALFVVLFNSNRTRKVAIMFWMKQLCVPDFLPWFWSEMVKSNRRSSVVWKEEQFVVSGSAVVIQSSLLSVGSHCSAPLSASLLSIMAASSFLWSWTWQVSRSERLTRPAGSSLCWPDLTLRDTTEIPTCPRERWLNCNLHLKTFSSARTDGFTQLNLTDKEWSHLYLFYHLVWKVCKISANISHKSAFILFVLFNLLIIFSIHGLIKTLKDGSEAVRLLNNPIYSNHWIQIWRCVFVCTVTGNTQDGVIN